MNGIERTLPAPHPDLGQLVRSTAQWLSGRGLLAADAVVLVPYAQLMPLAREAWIAEHTRAQACLLPRFVSTQQWASDMAALQPPRAGDTGWSPLASLAHAQARRMLVQTGLDKALGGTACASLIDSLLQAAQALVPRVQAMHPREREAWLDQMRQQRVWGFEALGFDADAAERSPLEALEPALLRIALEWVGMTRYDTDVLWEDAVRVSTPALVVWEGFQAQGLAQSLAQHWGSSALLLPWPDVGAEVAVAHQTRAIREQRFVRYLPNDEQQEAQWATACVLRHVQQGRTRIGVVALDRALVRRVHAMLSARQVPVHDTTGWKLSTTHAATQWVAWLEAVRHKASTQEVLDSVALIVANRTEENAPIAPGALRSLEQWLVQTRHFQWPGAGFFESAESEQAQASAQAGLRIDTWRSALQKTRSLAQWLVDARQVCDQMGLLAQFEQDAAGQALLTCLHMDDPLGFAQTHSELARERLSLSDFTTWVRATLEAESFVPERPETGPEPVVSIIPLSQVLGRSWDALVIPACDEKHLPWCPADTSPWARSQREKLGLPTDSQRSAVQLAAWQQALAADRLDVLSRLHDAGEPLPASPLLRRSMHTLRVQQQDWPPASASPMDLVSIEVQIPSEPAPSWDSGHWQGGALLQHLSPSAYEDLRRCPYRFHARRLLGLSQDEELSEEADKRDWGNWVHRVLHRFHTERKNQSFPTLSLTEQLDVAAQAAEAQMRLDGAAFVPFRAAWPSLRDAYVKWLHACEAQGGEFVEGEVDARVQLPEANVQLLGRLDRVDALRDGRTLIVDYKTESASKTKKRVSDPLEDTQLAFYALLWEPQLAEAGLDKLQAVYLNLGESGKTQRGQRRLPDIQTHSVDDLSILAQALREGIASDMNRLREGHALRALGDGPVCEHCEVRGLCRRDFWRGHEAA